MALLAHVGADGTYLRNVLPGMLVAGFGLGIAVVSVSIAILTGARESESGMISGLNSTGHEIGGTIGIAIFSTIAAGERRTRRPAGRRGGLPCVRRSRDPHWPRQPGRFAVLPHAREFVPKLRLNPLAMPVH